MEAHHPSSGSEVACWSPVPRCFSVPVDFSRICVCRYCGASRSHGQGSADFGWLGHPEISPNVHRRRPAHHGLLLSPRTLVNISVAIAMNLGVAVLFAQTLDVTPRRVLMDEVAVIKASGLESGERVTIRGRLTDGADHAWASKAEFVADEHGVVDVSKQAPASGSYKGISAMGLIWSMMPEAKDTKVYQAPKQLGAQMIRFELERKSGNAATAELEQISIADGVRRIDLKGPLHGALFEPTARRPHPGVQLLRGSQH